MDDQEEVKQPQRHTMGGKNQLRAISRSMTTFTKKRRFEGTICAVTEDDFDVEINDSGDVIEGISRGIIYDEIGPVLDIYVDDPVTIFMATDGISVQKVLFDYVDDVEEQKGKIKKITKNNLQVLYKEEVHVVQYDNVAIDGTKDIEGAKFKLIKPEMELKVSTRNGDIESVNVITGNASEESNPQAASGGKEKEVFLEVTAMIRGEIPKKQEKKEEEPKQVEEAVSPWVAKDLPEIPKQPEKLFDYPVTVGKYRIPIKLMKNEFKFNPLLAHQLNGLQSMYESYRMMRGDGNCYYRGVAVCLSEYLLRQTTQLDSLREFIHDIETGSKYFIWNLEKPKQYLLKKLKQLYVLKKSSPKSAIACLQAYLEEEYFDKALVAFMRQICVNYLYENQEQDDILPFLIAEDLQDTFAKIVTLGQEAEGLTLLCMARGLNINIVHYTLYRDERDVCSNFERQKTVYEAIDPERPVFHLILRPGHYDILYPYEFNQVDGYSGYEIIPQEHEPIIDQMGTKYPFIQKSEESLDLSQYERLVGLLSDTLSKGYGLLSSQDTSTQQRFQHYHGQVAARAGPAGVSSLPEQLSFNNCPVCKVQKAEEALECGHWFCNDCLLAQLSTATNGNYITNRNEHSEVMSCPTCTVPVSEFDVLLILGELHQFYVDQAKDRLTCDACGASDPIQLECHNICVQCWIANIRRDGGCPKCGQPSLIMYGEVDYTCKGCNISKNLSDQFPQFQCPSNHELICKRCLGVSGYRKQCIICPYQFTSDELITIANQSIAPMAACQIWDYDKPMDEFLETKWEDDCWVCKSCLVQGFFEDVQAAQGVYKCPYCSNPLSKQQQQELDFLGPVLQQASESPVRKEYECKLCMDEFPRSEMITLDCDHFFWEGCLYEFVNYAVNNRQFSSEGIKCPVRECECSVGGMILEANMSNETFHKFNKLILEQTKGLVSCPSPGCENAFIVGEEAERNINCPSCGFEFWMKCRNEAHEGMDCEQVKVMQAIDIAKQTGDTVAQCPGCHEIYTKDDACEHVKCLNPQCQRDFWFKCSAFRSPTLAHGNHYHRPQCKFYSEFNGKNKFEKACEICKEQGKCCKPPKDLKHKRLFI